MKRKPARRPFWLPLLYIAMMGIGFWDNGMGLPWFMKYMVQVGVVGLALCFLLVSGDFARLSSIGEYYAIFLIPFIMMAAWSMFIWALEFQQMNYMTRGCSTILYHMISLTAMCAAVYLFGGRTIDYTFYGMCIANLCILFMDSIRKYGMGEFVTGFIAFVKSGGVDTNAPIKALEVHDLTFGFGLMILYYAIYEKGWKRVSHFGLAVLFFYLGLKRIALIGMAAVFVMHLFVSRLKPRMRNFVLHSISVLAIVICFFYVYFIQSGLFVQTVDALGIDTMGRRELYAAFTEVYGFSPGFRGYGIGWVTRYISIMTEQGVGVFGTHNFGGMHNDIVTMYIELGFWGFALWIWLSWQGKVVWCQKQYNTETAFLLLYCTIYAFVTYATDNTAFYCYMNTIFMLLPIGHAMKLTEQDEARKDRMTEIETDVILGHEQNAPGGIRGGSVSENLPSQNSPHGTAYKLRHRKGNYAFSKKRTGRRKGKK